MFKNYVNPFFEAENELRRLAVHFGRLGPLAAVLDDPDKIIEVVNKILDAAREAHELTLRLHDAVLEQQCNALQLPTECPDLVESPAWCSSLVDKKFPLRAAAEPDRPASAG